MKFSICNHEISASVNNIIEIIDYRLYLHIWHLLWCEMIMNMPIINFVCYVFNVCRSLQYIDGQELLGLLALRKGEVSFVPVLN